MSNVHSRDHDFWNAIEPCLGKDPLPYAAVGEGPKREKDKTRKRSEHMDGYMDDGNRHVGHANKWQSG